MTERITVNADLGFVQTLLSGGAADLKYCYQCSTCTVVCPVTPDGSPFPRKKMIHAQFGLKEKLVKSLDSWLCINCNDCSTYCPRGAKPGDVMNAIRALSVEFFSVPGFLARAAKEPARIWILFLIPAVILAATVVGLHGGSGFAFLAGRIVYAKMLPIPVVDAIFISAMGFAGITLLLGLWRFLRAMREEYPRTSGGESIGAAIAGTATDIFSHRKFRECGTNSARSNAHLLVMYGFLGLMVTTTLVGVLYYFNQFGMDVEVTPYSFFHPVKVLGNVSGTMALLGCVLVVARKMGKAEAGSASFFDWTFVWVLFLTVITGFLAQLLRVFDFAPGAYFIYYVHLIFVFFLLAYAAHTKMGHIFFRVAAMVYSRISGREVPAPVSTF